MNPALLARPTTDPAPILRYRDGEYAAGLLGAAILHFDFFSWLKRHPDAGSGAIASGLGIAERPLDVLLTLCRSRGFVTTDGEGRHRLTPVAMEHLVSDSPWFLGPYYAPIAATPVVESFVGVLKTGRPANWRSRSDAKDWHESMKDAEFAAGFTRLMNARGLALGQALAHSLEDALRSRSHLLDVGGGSGIYAAVLVASQAGLRATVLEQPPVDDLARQEMARHGLSERVGVVTADMFQDAWPAAGVDVVLLSNVLHDWDVPEVRTILKRAADALPKGGLLVIHDAFIDDDKGGPAPVAEYSALLMNITQGKCYSASEYSVLLAEAGFETGSWVPTVGDRGYLTATFKGT